ncbi:MAG: long-chain fatty acid--CoA ligase, partial [bacterium]|nr:long-chain fatty acid--CoA ligase [bacterium]
METNIKFSIDTPEFESTIKSNYPNTLNELLERSAEKFGDKPSLSNVFEPAITYGELFTRVEGISQLLVKRGVNKGDRIVILGENSPNWGIAYFATLRAGAIAVPILPDFHEADIRHVLEDCEAIVLFTTKRQLEKLVELDHTRLKSIITLDDFTPDTSLTIKTETISNIASKAFNLLKKIPKTIGLVSNRITENDTASIIYTSGTSGHSKAVMLTHKNLVANVTATTTLIDFTPDDRFLSILPMSHAYEFTIGFMLPLISGSRIIYLGKPPTPRLMEAACKKEQPTAICCVPLIMEKIYKKKVLTVLEKNKAIKLFSKIPLLKRKIYKKINTKLLEFFGGKLRIMAVGGASFNSEAELFFKNAGFPYLVGYGLTETSPLLAGGPWGDRSINTSSCGKITPGCRIKIENPDPDTGIGDIIAKGPNVMKGYYKNPKLTAEVIDTDGWFKTGDLGFF